MRKLETTFELDGFTFRQVKRAGQVALFAKTKPTHRHECYEVVLIQRHPAEQVHGTEMPAREAMPPSEAWGRWGWSYAGLQDATRRFKGVQASTGVAEFDVR